MRADSRATILSVATLLAIGLTGCDAGPIDAGRPVVVVTNSILADVVSNIAGAAVVVETLIPPGSDPHDFQLSSAQITRISQADLVIINGLGLEMSIETAIREAAGEYMVEVAPLVDPIYFSGGAPDPHFWHDPRRMITAVTIIADRLKEIDGVDPEAISANAGAFSSAIAELDTKIASRFESVPAAGRVMVTNHDALGYLAARYDIEIIGVIIPGGSTLTEPSSAELARLVAVIRDSEVRAIFADNVHSDAVAEALAAEVGTDVEVVELFTDSLGPGGGETYLAMLSTNADRIVEAMR